MEGEVAEFDVVLVDRYEIAGMLDRDGPVIGVVDDIAGDLNPVPAMVDEGAF